jgi:hypothetical protein
MARKTQQFAEEVENNEIEVAIPVPTEGSNLVQARIKGTWKMYWGKEVYNFVDGKRFNISKDLYDYLRKSGNIYDTL